MRVPGQRLFWALPLLCLIASPKQARGQELAVAEALFNKGVADLEAGKYDTACPALAESQRLDPRPGSLFAVADCRDKQGQIATAAALYEDYLRAVEQMTTSFKLRHHDRAKTATARKEALSLEVPVLTLTLPEGAPADVKVVRDGVAFSQATFGVPLPVDPGEHVIRVQVGDGPVHEQRVTLQKRDKKTVVLELAPMAAPAAATAASSAAPVPVLPKPPSATPPKPATGVVAPAPEPPRTGMSGRRIGALAVGGLGLSGLALGAAMGAIALDKKGAIDAHCPEKRCDGAGAKALHDAQLPGLVSTIGLAAGGAGLAAAAILWLTAPSSPAGERKGTGTEKGRVTGTLEIGPTGAAIGVKGGF